MPTIVRLDSSEMFSRIFEFFALLPVMLLVLLPLSDTWWLHLHLQLQRPYASSSIDHHHRHQDELLCNN